jgi:uncharacterized membrane protein
MNLTTILRLLHIGAGVFWAGALFFNAILLEPAMRQLGPQGGAVMQALVRRGMQRLMLGSAVVTILAGLALISRDAQASNGEWMGSPMGITISIGALLAIVVFIIGFAVTLPALKKLGAIGGAMASASDERQRQELQGQAQSLSARLRLTLRINAVLLGITVAPMAIARTLA